MGLFSDERPLRKLSPDAEVDEPTSVGSAELMLPRYIRAIAIAGFCALPKWEKRTSAQLVPPWCPRSSERTSAQWWLADIVMERPLCARACASRTSDLMAVTPNSFAAAASVAASRPVIATRAPSATNRRAVARPIPLFPPVIRAHLPFNCIDLTSYLEIICVASRYRCGQCKVAV